MTPPESPYLYSKLTLKDGQIRSGALVLATDIAVVLTECKDDKPRAVVEYEQKTLEALAKPENALLVRKGLQARYQVGIPIGELDGMRWFAHGSVSQNKVGQLIYYLHYAMV